MEPLVSCGSCMHQAIDQPVPSCAVLGFPSLGLNLPPSYTNTALAHFYCCKLFMRGMLNLETEVQGKLIPCYFYLSVLFFSLLDLLSYGQRKKSFGILKYN
jgi:hypothetical protein